MVKITREFVRYWSSQYDRQFGESPDALEERAIRGWLAKQGERKFLNKEYFVRLGRWKTKRQTSAYKSNDAALIEEATRLAYEATDERLKLHILKVLRGVNVAVAGTILHYLHPDRFAIFDIHARASLQKAGLWGTSVNDSSEKAWLKYTATMRNLSDTLGVSLRELDKALWAYDKWGGGKENNMNHLPSGVAQPEVAQPQSRKTEINWLSKHGQLLKRLAGQWVAVEGEQLVAYGQTLADALEKSRAKGVEHPFVTRLPRIHEEEVAVIV